MASKDEAEIVGRHRVLSTQCKPAFAAEPLDVLKVTNSHPGAQASEGSIERRIAGARESTLLIERPIEDELTAFTQEGAHPIKERDDLMPGHDVTGVGGVNDVKWPAGPCVGDIQKDRGGSIGKTGFFDPSSNAFKILSAIGGLPGDPRHGRSKIDRVLSRATPDLEDTLIPSEMLAQNAQNGIPVSFTGRGKGLARVVHVRVNQTVMTLSRVFSQRLLRSMSAV